MGDIIYALPAIRAAGGGVLYLYHQDGKTWHGMDAAKAASLRSLLIVQPYIHDVIFCDAGHPPGARDHDLNGFRDHGQPGRNLADMHLATQGMGREPRESQWLEIKNPEATYPVVFARSARCRNRNFPWPRVWQMHRQRAGFLGSEEEHEDFCRSIGYVPRIPTLDLLAVAQAIAGSELFVGNQSCPAAIAEGLKRPMILEVFPECPNCCFERPNRLNLWNDRSQSPEALAWPGCNLCS